VNPFEHLSSGIVELLNTVAGQPMYGGVLTTYTPFILLILFLAVVIIFAARSRLVLIPPNRFVGFVEFFVNFTKNEIGENALGPAARKHLPFLLTLFLFILTANLVGIIPGSKAATGTIGTTLALTIISFVYFTYYGIRHHGLGGYLLSYKPPGVAGFLGWSVWFLELFSMILRLLTLSVRLFANMFAGHLLLGVLALLTTLFITPLVTAFAAQSVGFAAAGVLFFVLLTVMYAMELFVACVQAYVFTLLTSVYVMLATSEH
jgi:F-type H+-transporting ATPase subunit a